MFNSKPLKIWGTISASRQNSFMLVKYAQGIIYHTILFRCSYHSWRLGKFLFQLKTVTKKLVNFEKVFKSFLKKYAGSVN